MSVETERWRKALTEQALKYIARTTRNPFYRTGQLSMSDYQAAIGKLPHGDSPEMQIMDSASANYGKFIFLVDFDDPNDPNVVVI
jgi:hypothetical protein